MKKEKTIKVLLAVCITIFLITLLSGAAVFFLSELGLSVRLKGEKNITIPYGETYREPGYHVVLAGKQFLTDPMEMDVPVTVSGEVPAGKVGDFTLHYSGKLLWMSADAERTVHVVDEIPPEITLISNENQEPQVPYVEEGYRAADNVDGDITDQVVRREYEGEVHYTVADSSGNETTVIRKVRTFDITPPVITLVGEQTVELPYGTAWNDLGFRAEDAVDGDLTASVVMEGNVDPWVPGTYTIIYKVADSSENEAVQTRTVTVAAAPRTQTVLPNQKTIYLTFDDGPGPYTDQLLDVLGKFDIKATFFVVGSGHAAQMKRIVNEGHSIAVHSVTHNYKQIYASKDAYFQDLLGEQKFIEDNTGVKTWLLRFPGGGSNMVSSFNPGIMTTLTQAVQDAGFQYFDWNVDSNDAGGAKTPEEVYENVTEGCRKQRVSVVLQHDIHPFSVAAVENIIRWGLENGYQFLPLDKSSFCAHHRVFN